MLNKGQIVGGRFRIIRALGIGGMGTVWVAEHIKLGMLVALKLIAPQFANNEVALLRFRREARAAAAIQSPHVVRILDYDVDDLLGPFLAMELLEGEDLAARLAREMILPPRMVGRIMMHVGRGLQAMHDANIVHRDMKPSNVFLTKDQDGVEIAKILDFGVAKSAEPLSGDGSHSSDGVLVGTFCRMSPEQVLGQPVDHRVDIWGAGLVGYECFVGQPVFSDSLPMGRLVKLICSDPMPVPSEARPLVPRGFDAWFAKSTARQPQQRFSSAMEQAQALTKICEQGDEVRPQDARFEGGGRVLPVRGMDDLSHRSDGERYYVTYGAETVGPVSWKQLNDGWIQGKIPWRARVWRVPWLAWHMIGDILEDRTDTIPDSPRPSEVARMTLGPPSIVPQQAPPIDKAASAPTMRAPAKLGVPQLSAEQRANQTYDPGYYVADGQVTVGPVTPEMLKQAARTHRLPVSAKIWRLGWDEWRAIERVLPTLQESDGPISIVYRDKPGIETLAPRTLLPIQAPKPE